MGVRLSRSRTALAAVIALACLRPLPVASADDIVARLAAAVNANDKDAFLKLFDGGYAYNGESRESVLRYLFVIEGGRKGHHQSIKILDRTASQDGSRIEFGYENCLYFAPPAGVLEKAAKVCGGGRSLIELRADGKIVAYRPITNHKQVANSIVPTIEGIKVNGRAVGIEPFQEDLRTPAGRGLSVECGVHGHIVSVSLVIGSIVASTQLELVKGRDDVWAGRLDVPVSTPPGRYFLYIKPYTADYHTKGAGALRTVTIPFQITSPEGGHS